MEEVVIQLLSLCGAVLILAAFALQQFGRWRAEQLAYLVCNLAGASLLAAIAATERQWGFLLLESVWALVSLYSLLRRWAPRDA